MTITRQIAETVLIGPLDTALDHWREGQGCAAWIDSADRRCRRPTEKYLCTRHVKVALSRWEKQAAKESARQDKVAAYRAERLPAWREELAKVEAEINRLDPPRPADYDRAAITGYVHPSMRKKQRAFMSASRVQKMAELWRRHDELTSKIGKDA